MERNLWSEDEISSTPDSVSVSVVFVNASGSILLRRLFFQLSYSQHAKQVFLSETEEVRTALNTPPLYVV